MSESSPDPLPQPAQSSEHALADVQTRPELPTLNQVKYVIVDDDPDVSRTLAMFLKALWQLPDSAKLFTAASVAEAMEKSRALTSGPDFVLLDFSVGAEAFVQQFAAMLEEPDKAAIFKNTKIVLCSGHAQDADLASLRSVPSKVPVIGRLQKPSLDLYPRLAVMLADHGAVKNDDEAVEASRIALIPGNFSSALTKMVKESQLNRDDILAKEALCVSWICGLVNDARGRAKLEPLTQFDTEFDLILDAIIAQVSQFDPVSIKADLLFAKKAEAVS